MAVVQDPTRAFLGVWQPKDMSGSQLMGAPNTFARANLNARGFEKAKPFYKKVFGWGDKQSQMGEGAPPATEGSSC